MAQYVLQDMVNQLQANDEFMIDSAACSSEEIGNGVHAGTKRKLAEVGIPCGNHRARQISKADGEAFDYLIGMDDANLAGMKRRIGSEYHSKMYKLLAFSGSERDIADPWYTGNFDDTYEDVVTGCKALLKQLGY